MKIVISEFMDAPAVAVLQRRFDGLSHVVPRAACVVANRAVHVTHIVSRLRRDH